MLSGGLQAAVTPAAGARALRPNAFPLRGPDVASASARFADAEARFL
ncbi:hypothetical protein SAMN05428963_105323 [Consotaella salsifontis]|uniref:Uncharacterized protein n=1 Tax=Consotaella salsifontis TaxID=1365950 RepID=A0A1T4QX72_9HYPH|nr:hypothetical protein SAMN05428963_105323 [Consotaella salsifontis]